MRNLEKYKAIGMMVARQAREKAASDGVTANEVISMAALLKPWEAGTMGKPIEYAQGDVCVHSSTPWRCAMAHTHSGEEGWAPGEGNSMWFPYHATDKAHALAYVTPTCAEDAYNEGEWMIYTDGLAYECRQDATVYGPDTLLEAWKVAE